MKIILAILIMTTITTAALVGVWKNELGSKMTISTVAPDNTFSGVYETAVSGNGTSLKSDLAGKFTLGVSADMLGTLAFSVNWDYKNAQGETVRSTSTWAGFWSQRAIWAQWLLSRSCTAKDMWQHTLVGKDVFNKIS